METIKTYLKNISFFASLLGIYYLFVFAYTEKISFPLEITVLPSLVLALGLLSILFTLVIILYSSISFFVIFDPLKISYKRLFYAKPHYSCGERFSSVINFLLFFGFSPGLLYFLISIDYPYFSYAVNISLFVMPLLLSYYFMTSNKTMRKEKFRCWKFYRFWRTYITFLFIGLFSFVSIVFFMKYMKLGLGLETDKAYSFALFIFFLLSYLLVIPPEKKKITNPYAPELPLYKKAMNIPASFAYLIAAAFAVLPPVAANTASASLRFLQIGGGLERSYYYPVDPKIVVPKDVADCVDGLCVTKSLKVVLDLGALLYVRGKYFGEDNTVISLPRQSMSVIIHEPKPAPNVSAASKSK